MRLINTSTGALEEFLGDDVPEYAILSHTWGSEEVSHDEYDRLTSPTLALTSSLMATRQKAGFIKISKFLQLAASQGIGYVWADTCCIDKTSSTELSEAINSMYRWYQRAKICYAYLSDVETGTTYHGRDTIKTSRWFSRGWTLQELISSKVLHFYTNTWELIASKEKLQVELQSWTGIPSLVISSGNPQIACIGMRMSWASRRQTTRAEDIAYCMMGIFDINMPLLYGEGEKAFIRLQEHISAATTDHSLFVWNIKLPEEQSSCEDSMLFHRGLFARSPKEFEMWSYRQSDVQMGERVFSPPEVFSQTNRGFHVVLPTLKIDSIRDYIEEPHRSLVALAKDEYVAVLNCSQQRRIGCDNEASESYFAILLTRIDPRIDENDGFARVGQCVLLGSMKRSQQVWSPSQEQRHEFKRRMWISQRIAVDKQYSSLRMSGFTIGSTSDIQYTLHSLYPLNAQDNVIYCPPRPLVRQEGFVGLAVVQTSYIPGVWAVVFGSPPNSESPLIGITKEFDSQSPLNFTFLEHIFGEKALGCQTAMININHRELMATISTDILDDKLIARIYLSVENDYYFD